MPPARIAECAVELQGLLGEHGFLTGVAGHASAGNLHFMLTPDFAKQEDLERYESFMSKLVEMIVGSTTARSRPSTAPGSTWRRSWSSSGASGRPS